MTHTTFTTATPQAPVVEPRTITYPLKTGGSLTATCPAWCTTDHTDDVTRGINPADLLHQGDTVGLDYDGEGIDGSILVGRIQQWPFCDGPDAGPAVEFTPEGSNGVCLVLRNRLELDDEIRRVRAHLHALVELGDQLAEAQADEHARQRGDLKRGRVSLSRVDIASMPVAYLLKAFGVTVVETDTVTAVELHGEPGAMELRVPSGLAQREREDQARSLLSARQEGGRG
ncbi:DUF6907 domain-containing protein [Streptomyces cavernae]|uniref:DUF6907 domain-containing protein n=1 Tax=Streptomyces cavernae TaxID=2259034 RepID=UPI000FEBA563|nr:hypothetical protein [Streptomyces cavernae]